MKRVRIDHQNRDVIIGACRLHRHPPVGPRLSSFYKGAVAFPSSPASRDWSQPALTVLHDSEGNTAVGNCVEASEAHYIAVATGNADGLYAYSTSQTLAMYSAMTGFNPADPSTDQGTDPIACLNYLTQNPYADGTKLAGWALVDAANQEEVKYAINTFGNDKVWLGLPDGIVNDIPSGDGFVWDTDRGSPDMNNGHCFTGDTKVSLLDGREFSFEELAAGAAGAAFGVYSCDVDGNVVAGRAHSVRKTRASAELVAVLLDNGETIRCTGDHRFLMRDGSYKEAKEMKSGDSLMPLYRRVNAAGYEQYANPRTRGWHATHRMVAYGPAPRPHAPDVAHHVDFNKRNNAPENLVRMSRVEHTALHKRAAEAAALAYAKTDRGRAKSSALMSKLWADPAWRERQTERLRASASQRGRNAAKSISADPSMRANRQAVARNNIKLVTKRESWSEESIRLHRENSRAASVASYAAASPERLEYRRQVARANIAKSTGLPLTEKQRAARRENIKIARRARIAKYDASETPSNHKVVSVVQCGRADVYDMTVDVHHNFALAAGVFVHNCIESGGYNDQGIIVYTWGMIGIVTWRALAAWCVASAGGNLAVRVSTDWVKKSTDQTPSGLNAAAMVAQFNQWFNQNVPVPPAPAPTPPPTPPAPTPATLASAQAAISGAFAADGHGLYVADQAISLAQGALTTLVWTP